MLKVEIGNNEHSCLEFHGNLRDAVNHSVNIINAIYEQYAEEDRLMAELFKAGVMALVGDPKSPVWELYNQEDGIKSVEIKIPDGFQMPGEE
jgi:hypothetical protein